MAIRAGAIPRSSEARANSWRAPGSRWIVRVSDIGGSLLKITIAIIVTLELLPVD